MPVNKENIELWCSALEARGNEQCRSRLREENRVQYPGSPVYYHCALGIGVDVALQHGASGFWYEGDGSVWGSGGLTPSIATFYGFDREETNPQIEIDGELTTVIDANDTGIPFFPIAQALRAKYLKDEG